jgi:hypothetical protein
VSGTTIFVNLAFFVALVWGVWWLAWQTSKAHHELLREEEQEQEQEEQEKKAPKKKYNPSRSKKKVTFVDADEDEEEEFEAPKPAGQHIYDPKQHKVVWVPAE